jgi:hypothetical protein
MSSLESFKKELMKKPNVQERIPVFVIVKEFIDETTKSYDRDDIIQTLVDKKMTKVTKKTKPIKEREREKEKVKKAKPIKNLVTKMIIEEDSSEEETEKEVKQRKPTKVKKGEVTIGPESIVTIKDVAREK